MKDSQIEYWASLCEDVSVEPDEEMNESYEQPYCYDVADGNPEVLTVGALKKILANFKDNDRLNIIADGDMALEIKALWNVNAEYEMTGNDAGDDVCFIRVN